MCVCVSGSFLFWRTWGVHSRMSALPRLAEKGSSANRNMYNTSEDDHDDDDGLDEEGIEVEVGERKKISCRKEYQLPRMEQGIRRMEII